MPIPVRELFDNKGVVRLQGLTGPAQALITAELFAAKRKNLLIITPDIAEAERFANDISLFLTAGSDVIYLPQYETLPYEPLSPHIEVSAARNKALATLAALEGSSPFICVTTIAALTQRCAPPEIIAGSSRTITKGKEINIESLKDFLDEAGYSFCDPVDEPGMFAIRGGILDIFPPSEENPIRIELFGDEVEIIKYFDLDTQRSLKSVNEVEIPSVKDASYGGIDLELLIGKLGELEKKHSVPLDELKAKFRDKQFFQAMELFLPYFYKDASEPLDFLPSNFSTVICEPERVKERQELFLSEISDGYAQAIERGEYYPSPDELYADANEIESLLKEKLVLSLTEISMEDENENIKTIHTAEPPRYRGAFNRYIYDCRQRLSQDISSIVLVSSQDSIKRMEELFEQEDTGIKEVMEKDMPLTVRTILAGGEPSIISFVGALSSGFISQALGIAITTEEEIFGRARVVGKRKKARKEALFVTDFSDISQGDYVVHSDHGVGIYHGTKVIAAGNASNEYLELEYAESQQLFMPIANVYMLEKYSGSGGPAPKLDRMGGKTWEKTKRKVKESILKMAGELLELYAKRETGKAFKFSTSNTSNEEFAETFEHIETRDQANAINDVFKDMASDKPMDRLICGDVGYGKTEVALRAAFAAAAEGKQTAILVPTTLLANQHYDNFKTRMGKFGVKVELLSRFVHQQKLKKAIEDIGNGKVDVVIGTHKLLQKDIKFNDLGLVIIDEEQRFGVAHKEKLKKLRATVDLLTLTATPIPRTLHMSLSGIRDISIISTPPPSRRSIKTYIRKSSDTVIIEAVNRELSRGGQIFFVHNRVENIMDMHSYLKGLTPRARIAVGHGQMSGEELEKTMEQFTKHKIDILLCTTIIESGLDIPNANTIIINRADTFGLSQLYQLRGRVGRDKHRAYAYMLVPEALTPTARKRIAAIEELSALGSSFKLASRDMEIRGAGNMLGSQQSGQVSAVGFETYCRMLADAVEEIKSGKKSVKVEAELDIYFNGKLEESYIPMLDQRMNYYNKLHRSESIDGIKETVNELKDRYGELPEKAVKLVDATILQFSASTLGIEKLKLTKKEMSLTFSEYSQHVVAITKEAGRRFPMRMKPSGESRLTIDIDRLYDDQLVQGIIEFFQRLLPKDKMDDDV